jgi:hypothetical protein
MKIAVHIKHALRRSWRFRLRRLLGVFHRCENLRETKYATIQTKKLVSPTYLLRLISEGSRTGLLLVAFVCKEKNVLKSGIVSNLAL